MSRPSTPLGLSPRGSPRGSFANLADAALFSGAPRDEKERARAEIQKAMLKANDEEKAKKEEAGMPVASPGRSRTSGRERTGLMSVVWPILSYCVASIMMTVVNKFVVSGSQFTMTFLRER